MTRQLNPLKQLFPCMYRSLHRLGCVQFCRGRCTNMLRRMQISALHHPWPRPAGVYTSDIGKRLRESWECPVHLTPMFGRPRAWCRRAESNDISSAAPMAHMSNAFQDALHRRDAVNAQQTAASCMPAAKERSRKRDRESARNLTRWMVPQTVCGTIVVGRFGGVDRRFIFILSRGSDALHRRDAVNAR